MVVISGLSFHCRICLSLEVAQDLLHTPDNAGQVSACVLRCFTQFVVLVSSTFLLALLSTWAYGG